MQTIQKEETILKKKNKVEGLKFTGFKTFYKITVIRHST